MGIFLNLHCLLVGNFHGLGNFLQLRLPAQARGELLAHLVKLINRFHHMHRNANSSRMIRQCARNRLTNPPGGIGAKLKALGEIKPIHSLHQAHITLLD